LPKLRPHCSATCPETLRAEPQKEKCPFHFQKKFHPRQIKKARDIFLWGCWHTRQCVGLSPNHLF